MISTSAGPHVTGAGKCRKFTDSCLGKMVVIRVWWSAEFKLPAENDMLDAISSEGNLKTKN